MASLWQSYGPPARTFCSMLAAWVQIDLHGCCNDSWWCFLHFGLKFSVGVRVCFNGDLPLYCVVRLIIFALPPAAIHQRTVWNNARVAAEIFWWEVELHGCDQFCGQLFPFSEDVVFSFGSETWGGWGSLLFQQIQHACLVKITSNVSLVFSGSSGVYVFRFDRPQPGDRQKGVGQAARRKGYFEQRISSIFTNTSKHHVFVLRFVWRRSASIYLYSPNETCVQQLWVFFLCVCMSNQVKAQIPISIFKTRLQFGLSHRSQPCSALAV